jgi:hypothetical protein
MNLSISTRNGDAALTPDSDADDFIAFMRLVWGGAGAVDYDKWSDARRVLREFGGRRTGGTSEPVGERTWWEIWTLPNGARLRVVSDGSGIERAVRSFKPRTQGG